MDSAKNIVDAVNRVLTVSALELMDSSEYWEYAATKSAKYRKAQTVEQIRFKLAKFILESELKSCRDPLSAIRLAQLVTVANQTPDRLLEALHQIGDVFNQLPFAEYHKRLGEEAAQ
jgi:hypothetical protein